jgi:predicted RNA binding protein YcfA (HicA-like mRNA interferase family)
MSKVPSLPYTEIVKALERAGWTVTRQRGSHTNRRAKVHKKRS